MPIQAENRKRPHDGPKFSYTKLDAFSKSQ
jgi:hypothetical protein